MEKNIFLIILLTLSFSFVQAQNAKQLILLSPTHMDPVSVGAKLIEDENGMKTVLMKANIMDGYHIYAYLPNGEAYINSEFGIEVPKGIELICEWEESSSQVYSGNLSFWFI